MREIIDFVVNVSNKPRQSGSPGEPMNSHVRFSADRHLIPVDPTPQSLRHTFATRYLAAHPYDLADLTQLLGHNAPDTTTIQAKLTDEERAARIARMDLSAYSR